MLTKKMFINMAGLLLAFGSTQALSDTPNFFECKGHDVSLTFSTPGIASSTHINLNLGKKNYTAGKRDIETQATTMGDVKTMTLKFVPDVEIKKASFIIPAINLGENLAGEYIGQATFKSQLALTTIATPFIATPYIGVINKSRYIDLTCTASLVF